MGGYHIAVNTEREETAHHGELPRNRPAAVGPAIIESPLCQGRNVCANYQPIRLLQIRYTPLIQKSQELVKISSVSRNCMFTVPRGYQTTEIPLSLIHISEPTRLRRISYAVFCL